MKKLNILTQYDILIGQGLVENLQQYFDLGKYSKIIVVTDTNLVSLAKQKLTKIIDAESFIVLQPGEYYKTLENLEKIWKEMQRLKIDRKSLVINFGGGVIGDMGGFAASTYMRGVDFLQIPTTTLSQVDASIGGKLGIDFGGVKNLIGLFNQPIGVVIDVDTLDTLPEREFIAGFGEIIKHGIIENKEYFEAVTCKHPRDFSKDELEEIIYKSCQIKKKIIEADITEKNTRRLVNFGHTIGHAVESLSLERDKPFLHGEAVSIGMVAESKISLLKGILKQSELESIIKALKSADLPVSFKNFEIEEIMGKIKSDKKSEKGVVYFTLIPEIGKAITGQEVAEDILLKALQFIQQ